jgi:putative transposase
MIHITNKPYLVANFPDSNQLPGKYRAQADFSIAHTDSAALGNTIRVLLHNMMQRRTVMKKTQYTESQIIKVLKEVEGGRMVKEVCREYGISDAIYYNWKSKYGGMTDSDVKKLKELEDENRRLKRMFADLSLKHEALKDIVDDELLKQLEAVYEMARQRNPERWSGNCVFW